MTDYKLKHFRPVSFRKMPKWMRRRNLVMIGLFVVLLASVFTKTALVILGIQLPTPIRHTLSALEIVIAPIVFVLALICIRDELRLRKELAAFSHRLCSHCLYDLRGLGNRGDCPECGTPFDEHTCIPKYPDKHPQE